MQQRRQGVACPPRSGSPRADDAQVRAMVAVERWRTIGRGAPETVERARTNGSMNVSLLNMIICGHREMGKHTRQRGWRTSMARELPPKRPPPPADDQFDRDGAIDV